MPLPLDPPVTGIAHVIQLAVAPVFLLSGVGVMLGVLTSRLARIVDRARSLEARLPEAGRAPSAADYTRISGHFRAAPS